ncbi:ABC transporter substrate-binding protein [Nocardioides aquiterrae]|uniref:Extracellular solute-binding protein n=1 Tax=Nocardioides aquiterrae TaxID=203799 RepID=A0ABP4EYI1_9ACTN
MRGSRVRRTLVGTLTVVGLALAAVGCTDTAAPAPGPTTSPTPDPVTHLTFGVYGPAAQTAAFRSTVDQWNGLTDGPDVKLRVWDSHEAFRNAIESGTDLPDVFLTSRTDLRWLLDNKMTQPVDELLDERGVDFGDGYSRDALQAFSTDDRLQCMPYGVSPMVIYYNKQLVNFPRMAKRGLDAPEPDSTSWSFDQFSAAASFASRPRRGTKGVHIAATLPGLSPFVQSGGGSVFDDSTNPTSLTLSSDDSKAALDRTLQLLRNPQVTLDEQQLEQASPLTWFERGKLGMIAGYRSLVPRLRLVPDLDFDVMAMPSLGSSSTVGDVSGLCLSRKAASIPDAADFMVHELSVDSVTRVTRTGYLAPANLEVALSDTFLQPAREPQHSTVFNSAVRNMSFAPLIDTLPALEEAIQPDLAELVYGVGTLDLDAVTERIDETSRAILDPAYSQSPGPSVSPSD